MRRLLRFALSQGGMEVVEAGNGQQALDLLAREVYDLVITDLNMPIMDGITLVQRARANALSKTTPILVLTTDGQSEVKKQGRAAGVSGWIVKPFDSAKLVAAIEKLVA